MSLPETVTSTKHQALVPFSESDIWNDLRRFYKDEGIDAWSEKVPFFASSNAFVAESSFQVIHTFLMESAQQMEGVSDNPFILLEVGAGHGCFSFYLLQRLGEWLEKAKQRFTFIYVISDLVKANLKFCESNPAFAAYLEKDMLDFALWDAESGDELQTKRQSIRVGPSILNAGPVVVVANYLLDSLRCEYIRLEKGQFFRGWMPKNPDEQMATRQGNFLFPSMQFHPLEKGEIADQENLLERIKSGYPQLNACDEFLFPTGALDLLDRFHALSDVGTLFIANDKGSGRPRGSFPPGKPALAMNHTLSIDVPFDILSQWTEARGGQAIVTLSCQSVQNAGFLFPGQKSRFPFTEAALFNHFILHPPGNIFTLFQAVRTQQETADLSTLVACLNACQWDPLAFNELFSTLLMRIAKEEQNLGLLADVVDGMHRTAMQYYPFPGAANTLANIGAIFQEIGQIKRAIYYYQRSLREHGDLLDIRYLIGVCLIALEELEGARSWLESVVTESPGNFTARGYLNYCTEQIQTTKP